MSKELGAILDAYARATRDGQTCALATVVNVEGSSYRRPGARMLITESGEVLGCVSGGCLERDLVQRAGQLGANPNTDETRRGLLLRYDTREDVPQDELDDKSGDEPLLSASLGCNGMVDIRLEILPRDGSHALLGILGRWRSERREGTIALVTDASSADVEPGNYLAVERTGEVSSDVRNAETRDAITRELAGTREPGGRRVGGIRFLAQPFKAPVQLVLFGAGHDAVPMASFAQELGWEVSIVDCRSSLPVPRGRFAGVASYSLAVPGEACRKIDLTPATCAIVMTHNYEHDLEILSHLLVSPARYVGLLGARKRADSILEDLRKRGLPISSGQLARFHAPVGLDIGAETPEEIALSVLAEVRAKLAGRSASSLRDRSAPIHGQGEIGEIPIYILAAGESRRMGQPKQLLPWRGKSLVVHAAAEALASRLGPVHVVVGAQADRVIAAFAAGAERPGVSFLVNSRWESGPGSSVKTAIAHARETKARAALIVACDQPLISASSLQSLGQAHGQNTSAIVAATYSGTVGIPAIFPEHIFETLLNLPDGGGAKRVLETHRQDLRAVPLPEAAHDIDSPEDYLEMTGQVV